MHEISSPPCVKQRRNQASSWVSKEITSRHAQHGVGFRNEDEIASSNFEEQVEEICLADSGGPGLGSVRHSLLYSLIELRNSRSKQS